MESGRGSWFWTIVAGVVVATVPPIILFWMGINKPATTPQGGQLLKPGSIWTGTFVNLPNSEKVTKDMRLVISKREGNAFFGETSFPGGSAVFQVEGLVDQNAISWKNKVLIGGKKGGTGSG